MTLDLQRTTSRHGHVAAPQLTGRREIPYCAGRPFAEAKGQEKIAGLRLPAGVKLVPFYDQAYVIDGTIRTVERNLFEGFILVTIISATK